MRVGVSTAALFTRMNSEDALSLFENLGIETAEVFLTSFSEYDQKFGESLKERKGKIEIYSMHVLTTQFEPQLFSAEPRVKKDAFFWLERALEAGRTVGASRYTFHGTARIKRATRSGEFDNFQKSGESLRKIFDFCRAHGITLCLENVEWSTYNRPGVFKRMLEYCPDLTGVLDIKQARISAYPYPMYIKDMEGRISHVHLSDVTAEGKMCLPGKGKFDFSELIKRLNGAGFDGGLFLEPYSGDYSRPEELKTSCDYIEELLYKYGFKNRER